MAFKTNYRQRSERIRVQNKRRQEKLRKRRRDRGGAGVHVGRATLAFRAWGQSHIPSEVNSARQRSA
jgi:hypothetical protein